jgi:carboxyl-terminal processing protease
MPDPLPWDSVPPTHHAEFDCVAQWLSALREASARRVATSQDFIWMHEDDARIKAQLANPIVSLNEKERRQEKSENEARAEERKKERVARPAPVETRYEITLKNAERSGLPSPLSVGTQSSTVDDSDKETQSSDPAAPSKDLASDSILEETQRILLDYITLLNASLKPPGCLPTPGEAPLTPSQIRSFRLP